MPFKLAVWEQLRPTQRKYPRTDVVIHFEPIARASYQDFVFVVLLFSAIQRVVI